MKKEKNIDLGRKKGSSKKEAVACILGFTVATSHCLVNKPCQDSFQILRSFLWQFLRCSPLLSFRGWTPHSSLSNQSCWKAGPTDAPRAENGRRWWNGPEYSLPAGHRAFQVGNCDSDHAKGQNRRFPLGKQDMLLLVSPGWPPKGKSQSNQHLWPAKSASATTEAQRTPWPEEGPEQWCSSVSRQWMIVILQRLIDSPSVLHRPSRFPVVNID